MTETDYYYEDLPKYEAKTNQDVQHDAQILIDAFIGRVEPHTPVGLPMPLCLPQIGTGFDTPFARGWNDVLQQQAGISQQTFLAFVDGLNMAMIASPPLQVIDTAGMAIGFVPHWTFMLAGALMQTGAQVGMHVLSKTLSDRYLRAANERIFAPVGLRARLIKTPALRALVDHPDAAKDGIEQSKLKKFGRATGNVVLSLPLPLPFVKTIVRAVMDKPPAIDPRMTDPLARRLSIMHGHILPLAHGRAIPPPSPPDKILDKMNGFAVKRRMGKADKKDGDANVRRQIMAGMPVSREGGLTRKDYRQMRRGSSRRLQNKVEDDARKEHNRNEKLVWLVIINEADDAKIGGKDAVDSSKDDVTFDDRDLEKRRDRYVEEEADESSDEDGLEDYDPKKNASGSKAQFN